MMKKFFIHTLGCRLNQAESDQIIQKLCEQGYELVLKGEPADLCVINTCAVTHEAEVKCRKIIRQAIKKNPSAVVVVVGCYVEKDIETLKSIYGVDLIVDNKCKLEWFSHIPPHKLDEPIIVKKALWDGSSLSFQSVLPPALIPGFHRANIKIQEGCDASCTYCIIPRLRGPSRSRSIDEIINEVEWRLESGTKEIVLTGVNIGNYNWEGKRLVDLLDIICERFIKRYVFRMRLSSIELNTLNEEYLLRMADKDYPLVPYLHIPLQSGSNSVLRSMNRPYCREEYEEFIYKAVEMVEDIGISADIMVGFPGETSELFDETLSFIERLPIYFLHIFPFSPREGTPAYNMANKVEPKEIDRRVDKLLNISKCKRAIFYERNKGKLREVLFEEKEDNYWSGYTDNYIRVFVESDGKLENRLCLVSLGDIMPFGMMGTLEKYLV